MLQLKNIVKEYKTGDMTVQALKGIDIEFRKSEFVSVLGPSGCGKTTLLNIIGGLDRYNNGDLSIDNKSTKEFSDSDWDTYRNNSVGFVFQNYNLIPHQTVLSNVELALTLSGVSKAERRRRAVKILNDVGLGDQIHKKPNQMSGGQMQRVAIARALINNPEILLADEPTGALDSETSVQIMELLKEIAKDRLIVMVTHNPELAEKYSTRIIKLLDGKLIDDTNPYHSGEDRTVKAKKPKKTYMSFATALNLSLNNLMTKKTRTFMTSFAGSIGIIGIALILSLSSGVQAYITRVQEDTLSSYPLAIQEQSVDMISMLSAMSGVTQGGELTHDLDKIYSSNIMGDMMSLMTSKIESNNLSEFKKHLETDENKSSGIASYANAIQYGYDVTLHVYNPDTLNGIKKVNPNTLFDDMGMGALMGGTESVPSAYSSMSSLDVWSELLGNQTLLDSQFEVIAGSWPASYNEVVIIVDKNNEISDFTLYSLGLMDSSELAKIMKNMMMGKETDDFKTETKSYTYDELLKLKFKLVLESDYYTKENGTWADKSDDHVFMKQLVDSAPDIKIAGIVRAKDDLKTTTARGGIGYLSSLTEYVIKSVNDSEIVKQQIANADTDVFTGKPFAGGESAGADFDMSKLPAEQQAYLASLPEEERLALIASYSKTSSATYEDNLKKLGVVDLEKPSLINIYAKDFESKEAITDLIEEYNKSQENAGKDENVINYTDMVGMLMSSVTTIINAISYVLIAFVAISLVVSSIMIGIITYISVLERTKEIGILRSIGASKHDISRVFNAETLIIGFVSGALGIIVSFLLTIPINIIIEKIAGIADVAILPVAGALILVAISMALTFIAGLIPSKIAAKKDPVVALRTE